MRDVYRYDVGQEAIGEKSQKSTSSSKYQSRTGYGIDNGELADAILLQLLETPERAPIEK